MHLRNKNIPEGVRRGCRGRCRGGGGARVRTRVVAVGVGTKSASATTAGTSRPREHRSRPKLSAGTDLSGSTNLQLAEIVGSNSATRFVVVESAGAVHATTVALRERSSITATTLRAVATVGAGRGLLLLLGLEGFCTNLLDSLGTLVVLLGFPSLGTEVNNILHVFVSIGQSSYQIIWIIP